MAEEPDPRADWLRHARGHSSDDSRHFQHYLEVMQRWGTPAELEVLVKRMGDAARIGQKLDVLEARMEQWAWNRRFWGGVAWTFKMAGTAGALFGMLLAAREVLGWLTG